MPFHTTVTSSRWNGQAFLKSSAPSTFLIVTEKAPIKVHLLLNLCCLQKHIWNRFLTRRFLIWMSSNTIILCARLQCLVSHQLLLPDLLCWSIAAMTWGVCSARPTWIGVIGTKLYRSPILWNAPVHDSEGWFHQDLKPANQLVSNDRVLKIADCGFAGRVNESQSHKPFLQTLNYRSLEMLDGLQSYDCAVDVWSAG